MNIVLIGYRGTGKSTVAGILARRLGLKAVSTDAEIVRRTQQSIPELVSRYGWEHFRTLEADLCQELKGQDGLVIDTGGGIVLNRENVAALKANGRLFWLTADVPTIAARIGGDTQRPSLTGTKSFVEEIEEILTQRRPLYESAADVLIPTDLYSPEQIAEMIIARLSP